MENYKEAGVDLKKAENLAKILGKKSFAGIVELDIFENQYLAATTDGIGSKLIPLFKRNRIDIIANDLVAVNINDLICSGAKPVLFMDYIACNQLDTEFVVSLVKELGKILAKYNCKLVGGETSELKDIVKSIDIAGFMLGIVEKKKALSPNNVKNGDIIIGLRSSGPHANGYSLIRKLYDEKKLLEEEFEQAFAPNFIYADCVLELVEQKLIKSAANVTGGGVLNNLQRAIPDGFKIKVDFDKIPEQPLFKKLRKIIKDEAYSVFNMGIGFCLVANKEYKDKIFFICKDFEPFLFGKVVKK